MKDNSPVAELRGTAQRCVGAEPVNGHPALRIQRVSADSHPLADVEAFYAIRHRAAP